MLTHYERFGIKNNATPSEIRKAFNQIAQSYHPDVNKAPNADAIMRELIEIKEILLDPKKRREYDASISHSSSNKQNEKRHQEKTQAEIEKVWNNLVKHCGEQFTTVQKNKFSYMIKGDKIHIIYDIDYPPVSKKDIEEIINNYMPLKRVADIPEKNIGGKWFPRAYIFALLKDSRIY